MKPTSTVSEKNPTAFRRANRQCGERQRRDHQRQRGRERGVRAGSPALSSADRRTDEQRQRRRHRDDGGVELQKIQKTSPPKRHA